MTDRRNNQAKTPETMRDHWWWRPGWATGRRFYTWHVTFDDQPTLHRLAGDYQDALPSTGLDPIPPKWLHLTMQGLGFTDEVTESDVAAIVEMARTRCARLEPFEVTFGRPFVDPEAIMFRAAPTEGFVTLRTTVRDAIADVWGAGGVPEKAEGFAPHVSLAYSNATGPAAPFAEALSAVEADPVKVTINSAELIVIGRDAQMYTWEPYATVQLGKGQVVGR